MGFEQFVCEKLSKAGNVRAKKCLELIIFVFIT